MSKASNLHEPPQHTQAPKSEEISRQLKNILASPAFHGSRRCQQFLEYAVEKALAGESSHLKERLLAVEIFGRSPQTDLGEDTIVRVGAREVRKRLAQYYVTSEGLAAEVRIDLPPGSYVPEFRYAGAATEPVPEEAPLPLPPPPTTPFPLLIETPIEPWWRSKRWKWYGAGLVTLLLAVMVAVRLLTANPNSVEFARFWQPVFKSEEPLLIAVAHPIVYHPSGRALRLSEENQPPQDLPIQRPLQVPPDRLNGSDFVPVFNQYVGFGDMIAANEVSAMLARKSQAPRVRLANNISFADLKKAQTLLIGAVTNHWTMELQQAWRYRFAWTPGTRVVIVDSQAKPGESKNDWAIPAKDDGSALDDFVLVCRIHSGFTGGLVMVAAGLKQFGTEAAGHLLADPEQLGAILHKLSKGWENKNVQLVLHARVIGNTPAQPDVVASYVW